MTLDMDRLREALDLFDLVDWADEDTPEEWRDVYLQLGAAARVPLTGEKVWWCQEHKALRCCESHPDICTLEDVADFTGQPPPCRMVEALLIIPDEKGER